MSQHRTALKSFQENSTSFIDDFHFSSKYLFQKHLKSVQNYSKINVDGINYSWLFYAMKMEQKVGINVTFPLVY